MGTSCIIQGAGLRALWWSRGVECGGREAQEGEDIYNYDWFMLIYNRDDNIVK